MNWNNDTTDPLRRTRRDLQNGIRKDLDEMNFSMKVGKDVVTTPLVQGHWVEVIPGALARPIPIFDGSPLISIIVWEFSKEVIFAQHEHTSAEEFIMIRGELVLMNAAGEVLMTLNTKPESRIGTMPAGLVHGGKCSIDAIVVAVYSPAINHEEVLGVPFGKEVHYDANSQNNPCK